MPIHDWTRVDAGIFHDFHVGWVSTLSRLLNNGLLPPDHYALIERRNRRPGANWPMLRDPHAGTREVEEPQGGVSLADFPPRVRFHATAEAGMYAARANAVVVRRQRDHQGVAVVELVSPGHKRSRRTLGTFVGIAGDAIAAGIHLLVVDLFPPGPRDPQGIHPAIWGDWGEDFALPPDEPLTCAAYIGGPFPEAFVEPVSIGSELPDMPLFLTPDVYVPMPLEATYRSAWDDVPAVWRDVLAAPAVS